MAAAKKTYYDLLRDPRWQKRRLEVMERCDWTCTRCHAGLNDGKTFNVHHRYYTKGAKPWEYPDEALTALCEECHSEVSVASEEARRLFGMLGHFCEPHAIGYLKGILLRYQDNEGHQFVVTEYKEACGIGDAWGLTGDDVSEIIGNGPITSGSMNTLQDKVFNASYEAYLKRIKEVDG